MFIEFIRDMSNVWWSSLDFGPLSLFQWFLLISGSTFVLSGILLEKNYRSVTHTAPNSESFQPDFALITVSFLTAVLFNNQLQTIHLVQLAVMLPSTGIFYLYKLKQRYGLFSPIPSFASIVTFILLFSTPIISQIESRLDQPSMISSLMNDQKNWIYTINENNNTLFRIGDENLTFSKFIYRK